MKKFIYFDIDDTLIHRDDELTEESLEFLKNLSGLEYGICTNRPLLDVPYLDFLKDNKFYICEGGVISYTSDKRLNKKHPDAIEINHSLINKIAQDFLLKNNLIVSLNQNINRIYTSTLYVDKPLNKEMFRELGEAIIKEYPFPDSYGFVILNENKMSFTLKNISKEYMINLISSDNIHYYLITDHESDPNMNEMNNLSYIGINPENTEFNRICEYVSKTDFSKRIIDAVLYIKK